MVIVRSAQTGLPCVEIVRIGGLDVAESEFEDQAGEMRYGPLEVLVTAEVVSSDTDYGMASVIYGLKTVIRADEADLEYFDLG
jgi:hypothetical protein